MYTLYLIHSNGHTVRLAPEWLHERNAIGEADYQCEHSPVGTTIEVVEHLIEVRDKETLTGTRRMVYRTTKEV